MFLIFFLKVVAKSRVCLTISSILLYNDYSYPIPKYDAGNSVVHLTKCLHPSRCSPNNPPRSGHTKRGLVNWGVWGGRKTGMEEFQATKLRC